MSRNDYIKRFKIFIKRERELVRRENQISQKVDQYNALIVKLHLSLFEQSKKEKLLQEQIDLLECENKEIEQTKIMAENRLESLKLLCGSHIEKATVQASQTKNILQTREELHSLEESFCVLIKLKELPGRLRGITICDQEQTSKWTAFNIDPMQHTRAQVQDMIWQKAEQGNRIYQKQWKLLF